MKPWVRFQPGIKLDIVVQACVSNTLEVGTGRSEVQGHSWLQYRKQFATHVPINTSFGVAVDYLVKGK